MTFQQVQETIQTVYNEYISNEELEIDTFFERAEQIMDEARDGGFITDEEYCQLEMEHGF